MPKLTRTPARSEIGVSSVARGARNLFANLARMSKKARYLWMSRMLAATLAMQIKAMRLQRGWSQKKLAQEAGLGVLTVWRLERLSWLIWPSIGTLTKIAAALDVALMVRFAPWSELAMWAAGMDRVDDGLSPNSLCPKTFTEECEAGEFFHTGESK